MKNRLKELRTERRLSQRDLYRKTGIYANYFSRYEHERTEIPLYILMELADFYNTSIDYIMYRTDVREPYPAPQVQNASDPRGGGARTNNVCADRAN